MLKQNQTNMLYNIEMSPEVQIRKANDLVSSLEYDVEKYTTLLECAKRRRIEIIKSNVNYFMFQPYLRFAWEWLNVVKPKLLEQKSRSRKKPNESIIYKLLLDQIKRFVYKDIKNVTIENIYEHGNSGGPYQYSIDFFISHTRKNKRHFVFYIPVIECLNEENYKYVSEGKLQLGEYISESYIEIFFSTYDENELYNALVKRLSNEETKKNE